MKYPYIIPILMLFFSCNKDIQDITIQGTILNNNNKPISNVNVTLICWKYGNSPDESYSESETKIVITDEKGRYKVNFDKGAFVEIKLSLDGYIEIHESKEIYNKKNTINITLKPQ